MWVHALAKSTLNTMHTLIHGHVRHGTAPQAEYLSDNILSYRTFKMINVIDNLNTAGSKYIKNIVFWELT